MSAVKNLILEYHDPSKKMGGEKITTDIPGLRTQMEKISNRNGVIFWILVVMVALLFALTLLLVGLNLDNPDKLKLVLSITGVSITGLIVYMNKFWKEKNYIDLILIMITTLDPEKINAVLNALILKL